MNHKIVFKKIEKAFKESALDALVITGVDNLLYFSGTSLQNLYSQKNLPFIFFWRKKPNRFVFARFCGKARSEKSPTSSVFKPTRCLPITTRRPYPSL